MDFRPLIRNRLQEQRLKPADLLGRLKGQVGKQSLYDFLSGRSKEMKSNALGEILDALGLVVISKEQLARLGDQRALIREVVEATRDAVKSAMSEHKAIPTPLGAPSPEVVERFRLKAEAQKNATPKRKH